MVDVAPFRAIRYAGPAAASIERVLAPPYDVITSAMQDALYARHENNIVRIDLTRAEPGDGELSKYERAKSIFADWQHRGVMAADAEASMYVLAQTFVGPDGFSRTRTGFFSRARLTPLGQGPILPHERTLQGPKVDRLHLYRATKTNLSPIFGMVQDEDERIRSTLREAMGTAPDVDATMDKVQNRMWRVSDRALVSRIISASAKKKLTIADGHHRYETGLAYRDERRKGVGVRPEASDGAPIEHLPGYESILMFTAAVEDPGMVIFPTHRILHHLPQFDEAALLQALSPYFDRSEAPGAPDAALAALMESGRNERIAFLLVTRKGRHLLAARADAPWSEIRGLPQNEALRKLDLTILHSVVLEHALGVSQEAQAAQANLRYSKDFGEAMRAPVSEPDVQAAFLTNPTKIDQVIRVANSGLVMPQKSTFFYPKIPSGLVLYPLD